MKKIKPAELPQYELVSDSTYCCDGIMQIPDNATHYEAEFDYSSCYYEGDRPEIRISFYKKKL